MKTKKTIYFSTLLLSFLLFLNACSKSGSSCTTNAFGTVNDKEYCMTAQGGNYTSATLANGKKTERVRVNLTCSAPGGYYVIDVQTTSYNPPTQELEELKTGINYFDNFAWPTINDAVAIKKPGSFIFTKFDRVNRKMSGTFDFIYTINLTQGNTDFNVKGEFTDVSF